MLVYIVEDSEDIIEVEKYALERMGFEVEGFIKSKPFFEKVRVKKPDMILLDIFIYEESGYDVLNKLRASIDTKNIPVILVSACDSELDKSKGLDAGADDYISKPFDSKELLARIRVVTRRMNSEISLLEFGNTTLDHNTFELCAVSKTRLTNKEYKLMELLMLNKNSVLSTQKILDALWDIDDYVEINVVWVFISMLRKKLEEIGANCYIKAIRGVGYQLEKK